MSHWKYKGKYLKDVPEGFFGFVYLITNTLNGKKYVGRKYFGTSRRVKVKGPLADRQNDKNEKACRELRLLGSLSKGQP